MHKNKISINDFRRCGFVGNKAKGRISKRVFQESKIRQNFRNTNISYHTHVCVSGGKKCLFYGNFGVLCFLETPVLRFALLPYYRRFTKEILNGNFSLFVARMSK